MNTAWPLIIKTVIFFMGWAILSGIINVPSRNPAVWRFFAELIPFLILVLFTIVFLYIEKGTVQIPVWKNGLKGSFTGFCYGILWIGLSSGILLMTEQLKFAKRNEVSMLWLWILSAFINVVMQELLVRGYIYQLMKVRANLAVAVIVTTALFTFLHGGAFSAGIVPVLNVMTMCIFTTVLYEKQQTLLAPILAHGIWNIIGAVIMGGVNLADDYPHLYEMKPAGSNVLLSGGTCKVEGSIVVLLINIGLTVLLLLS